jgi:hypothetical protein
MKKFVLGIFLGMLAVVLVFALFFAKGGVTNVVNCVATVFTALATVTTAVVGAFFGIRSYLQQRYIEQYRRIMTAKALRQWRLNTTKKFDPESVDKKEHERLQIAALNYLNLCCEEFYGLRKSLLFNGIWEDWKKKIKRTLGTPLFLKEWKNLRHEFETYKKFKLYVDEVQEEAENKTAKPE